MSEYHSRKHLTFLALSAAWGVLEIFNSSSTCVECSCVEKFGVESMQEEKTVAGWVGSRIKVNIYVKLVIYIESLKS
jgi:hypothetical protein